MLTGSAEVGKTKQTKMKTFKSLTLFRRIIITHTIKKLNTNYTTEENNFSATVNQP